MRTRRPASIADGDLNNQNHQRNKTMKIHNARLLLVLCWLGVLLAACGGAPQGATAPTDEGPVQRGAVTQKYPGNGTIYACQSADSKTWRKCRVMTTSGAPPYQITGPKGPFDYGNPETNVPENRILTVDAATAQGINLDAPAAAAPTAVQPAAPTAAQPAAAAPTAVQSAAATSINCADQKNLAKQVGEQNKAGDLYGQVCGSIVLNQTRSLSQYYHLSGGEQVITLIAMVATGKVVVVLIDGKDKEIKRSEPGQTTSLTYKAPVDQPEYTADVQYVDGSGSTVFMGLYAQDTGPVVDLSCTDKTMTPMPTKGTPGEIANLLKVLNDARTGGRPKLVWDDKLAQYAQGWAEALIKYGPNARSVLDLGAHSILADGKGKTCYMTNYAQSYGSIGAESIGTPEGWIAEGKDWLPGQGTCRGDQHKGIDGECGHYLQAVAAWVTKVGCGHTDGNTSWVCHFDKYGAIGSGGKYLDPTGTGKP